MEKHKIRSKQTKNTFLIKKKKNLSQIKTLSSKDAKLPKFHLLSLGRLLKAFAIYFSVPNQRTLTDEANQEEVDRPSNFQCDKIPTVFKENSHQ